MSVSDRLRKKIEDKQYDEIRINFMNKDIAEKDKTYTEGVLAKLNECKNFFEVKDIIEQEFPGWFGDMTDNYSEDYDFLNESWNKLRETLKIPKQQIVLVSFIPNENDYKSGDFSLLVKFMDTMTANGFLVRRNSEYILCKYCKSAIPSEKVYMSLRKQWYFQYGEKVPRSYKDHCKECKKMKVNYNDIKFSINLDKNDKK